ncbi:MAG: DUF2793 domain-containing protein, partial [Pseudomonadota bacterium]
MQDVSARLELPFIKPSQAQKHVTHNEAIQALDTLVQATVEAFDAETPPALPEIGQTWALGAAPTADWAGFPQHLATWQGTSWLFLAPGTGWHAISATERSLRFYDGTVWTLLEGGDLNQVNGLGIGTNFDAVNKLAVSSDASLLNHAGSGHQVKVNKAAASDTASLLFQTGFSGRAEMGTAGSDDFEVKVSADGATWFSGFRIAPATGKVTAPNGLSVDGALTGSAVQSGLTDSTAGRLLTVGAFGIGQTGTPTTLADV